MRHAETEWTLSGRHTGRTDIPLTDAGREAAAALAGGCAAWSFALVLVSPSRRARETCELCGLGAEARCDEDLLEWDYGDYEGLTTRGDPRAPPGLGAVARRLPGRRAARPRWGPGPTA